jgi:acyl carrier protein
MHMNVYEELNLAFRKAFDDDEIVVAPETTANDIEKWDSLSHINLVYVIEKHFRVKFSNAEILKWKNVGQMADSISAKLQDQGA